MTTFKKNMVASCMVLVSTLAGFCAGPNLISDGGFELPVTGPGGLNSGFTLFDSGSTIASAWSVIGPPPSANVAVVPSDEFTVFGGFTIFFTSQEGNQNLDLSGNFDTGGAMGVQQGIPTVAGHTYALSFYLGAVTTPHWGIHAGNAIVNVQLNGSPLLSAVNSDASGDAPTWKQFSTMFTAVGPTSTLTFISGTGTGIGFNGLDNVSVLEVPEPGTCGLLALGLATWGIRQRKQKRNS